MVERTRRPVLGVLFLAVAVVVWLGVGGFGSLPVTAQEPVLISAEPSSETLSPSGGTLSFAGGAVTLSAPDGAVSSAVDIAYRPETANSIVISLGEMNDSGQSGTATLTANGDETTVVVAVTPGASGVSQPIHIHTGSCANLGGVAQGLTSVVDGASTSTVSMKLSDIRNGDHAINLHKSGAEAGVYTACGDIPAERPAPEGKLFGSQVFTLDALSGGVLQKNFSFKQLVSVTVQYTDADLAVAKGGRDDSVDVYTYDPVSKTWIELASGIPDVVNKTLTVSLTQPATLALVITPEPVAPTPTPTATPAPTATPTAAPPDTGDIAPWSGVMMGLAAVGAAFILGGGYILARTARRSRV